MSLIEEKPVKVIHYINQFFGGVGGEEAAGVGFDVRSGPVGPGMLIARDLPDAEITTVVCGDNYAAERSGEIVEQMVDLVGRSGADLVILGPAFNAGRYGLICGKLAVDLPRETGIPAITGLYEENAATGMYRNKALIVRTGRSAASMQTAIGEIVALVPRLVAGQQLSEVEKAVLFDTAARHVRLVERSAAERAVDMVLELLAGDDVGTELAVPDFEPAPPPAPVGLLAEAKVALVTEGGLVPKGNPDNLTTGWSERWAAYPVADLLEHPGDFEAIHGGYDTRFVNEVPYRLVPADVVSEMVDEGVVGSLDSSYYVTAGMATPVENSRKMGAEIAAVLLNEGVQAVIFTST